MKAVVALLLSLLMMGCNQKNEGGAVFEASLDTPMGHNSLKLFDDGSFKFEEKKLLSTNFYSGTWKKDHDTIIFSYQDQEPYFGNIAVLDGPFLVFNKGDANELLEIKSDHFEE